MFGVRYVLVPRQSNKSQPEAEPCHRYNTVTGAVTSSINGRGLDMFYDADENP